MLTSLDQSNNNKFGRWGSLRSSAVFGLFDLLRGRGGAPRKPSRAQQQGKEAARGNTQRAMNSWKWGENVRTAAPAWPGPGRKPVWERGHPRMRTEHREKGRDPIPSFSPLWHYSWSFSEKIARHAIASLIKHKLRKQQPVPVFPLTCSKAPLADLLLFELHNLQV